MAIDPVKVPTDIQIEEKIIGPIGLRQIFLLLGSGGFSYMLWSMFGSSPGASIVIQILSWLPLLIGVAFAFVKVHDVSLFKLMLLYIEKLQKPTSRTFAPRQGIAVNIRIDPTLQEKKVETKPLAPEDQLQRLSAVLDTGVVKPGEKPASGVPVKKERISASPTQSNGSVDGISAAQEEDDDIRPQGGGILRDLSPAS